MRATMPPRPHAANLDGVEVRAPTPVPDLESFPSVGPGPDRPPSVRARIAPRGRPAGRRRSFLPNGRRDALLQAAIWAGFAASYELVRGLAAGNHTVALADAHRIIGVEQGLHAFFEPSLQQHVLHAAPVTAFAHWTYWLAQFVVVAVVVTWIYLRRNHAYARLRDALLVTNTLGLVGYLAFPVAPPRLVPGFGFRETFSAAGILTQKSGLVHLLANPYAAFPSLHAADALILGAAVFAVASNPVVKAVALLWPFWVSFSLLLSANHFWLDVAAGIALATTGWLVAGLRARRSRPAAAPARPACPP